MRVVWTAAAQADLAEISDYIAADNPQRALSFINEIVDVGDAIADMPRAFPLVPQNETEGELLLACFGNGCFFLRIHALSESPIGILTNGRKTVVFS